MFKRVKKEVFQKVMVFSMILALTQNVWAVTSYNGGLKNSIGLSGSASILDLSTTSPAKEQSVRLKNAQGISVSNAKVTISLRDSDVRQVLRMLADKAKMNIIFHESVEGKVTLDLKNITLNEAFYFVLSSLDLNYYIEDRTIIVASAEAAKTSSFAKQVLTSFPIKYVNSSNIAKFLNDNVYGNNMTGISGNKIATSNPRTNEVLIFGTKSDAEVARKVIARLDTKPMINSFKVIHTTPKQMADFVCKTLFAEGDSAEGEDTGSTDSEVLGLTLGGGSVACKAKVDEGGEGNAVFKTQPATIVYMEQAGEVGIYGGSYEQARLVHEFIVKHDKKQTMAYIELNVIELNETGSNEFNSEWNMVTPFATLTFKGDTGLSLSNANILSVANGQWELFKHTNPTGAGNAAITTLKWLIKDGKGRTIANPKIMTTNGQTSTIDLTSDYVSKVTTQTTTVTGSPPIISKTYDIANDNGLKIEITPFISPEGYVSLNILPEFASIKQKIYSESTAVAEEKDLVATLLQRRDLELKNVRIKDGETLILAGFIQEDETQTTTKFPILGDLPVVGTFFRTSKKETTKEEMVIMITPHIVYDEENYQNFNKKNNVQL